jgi:hypothetical protein
MSTIIKEVKGKRDLKTFIHLPAKIHRGHHNWVPPVYMDEWIFFDPGKNSAFDHSETILLLAFKNKTAVGRIMGIINHKYNQIHDENDARFCFIETFDDMAVADELFSAVEKWAIEHGAENLIGPVGFSDKDPQGLLVDGFDEPMVISTNCNFPYMVDFITGNGFTKKLDLVVYKIPVPEEIPEFYKRIYERSIKNNPELRLADLKRKKDIKPFIEPVLTLMNETFSDIYGFSPLSVKEMHEFASRYLMILDPRFLKVILNENNDVIAFILAIPDISDGIIKSRGFVFPTGFYHILRSQKKTKRLSLLLGAIHKNYRRSGLDTILGISLLEDAKKAGLKVIDSHLEMESNKNVRAEMEKMGGEIYKRYRIYTKAIS